MNPRFFSVCLCVVGALFAGGCGGLPSGAHVRVSTATRAELERAVASRQRVYYDFEAGDRVPLVFGVAGLLEAESAPVTMVARRRFSVLLEPNGAMYLVLDGEHLTRADMAARWTMLFAPSAADQVVTGIVIGLGSDQDLR